MNFRKFIDGLFKTEVDGLLGIEDSEPTELVIDEPEEPTGMAAGKSTASAILSVHDRAYVETSVKPNIQGLFCAEIDCTGKSYIQIETAVRTNAHPFDPHPTIRGAHVLRHPIYLTGIPSGMSLYDIRTAMSGKYHYVSPEPPPSDRHHRLY